MFIAIANYDLLPRSLFHVEMVDQRPCSWLSPPPCATHSLSHASPMFFQDLLFIHAHSLFMFMLSWLMLHVHPPALASRFSVCIYLTLLHAPSHCCTSAHHHDHHHCCHSLPQKVLSHHIDCTLVDLIHRLGPPNNKPVICTTTIALRIT